MIKSQFNIGQSVQHKLLGLPGVVVDVDAEYGLTEPKITELELHESFVNRPWYHVILMDEDGKHIHTYLAENQISERVIEEFSATESLDEISTSVKAQYSRLKSRN